MTDSKTVSLELRKDDFLKVLNPEQVYAPLIKLNYRDFKKAVNGNWKPPVIVAKNTGLSSASLEALGGPLKAVVKELEELIALPLRYPVVCRSLKGNLPSGALLIGGTGSGKSALVTALVDSLNLPCETVKGSELLNKYLGASEEAVRSVFEKAQAKAPCVVFFDEIDALCPKRGSSNTSGVTDRVVNQLLCYLDGVEKLENVFVIAATSRIEILDPAVYRPGRLDKIYYCEYPKNRAEKTDILVKLLKEFEVEENLKVEIILSMEKVLADGEIIVTGADIYGILLDASILNPDGKLTASDIERSLQRFSPSLSRSAFLEIEARHRSYALGRCQIPDKIGQDISLA
jgi:SpoVK/Ycf46/Vps4 family AAA+-type ATPase